MVLMGIFTLPVICKFDHGAYFAFCFMLSTIF